MEIVFPESTPQKLDADVKRARGPPLRRVRCDLTLASQFLASRAKSM